MKKESNSISETKDATKAIKAATILLKYCANHDCIKNCVFYLPTGECSCAVNFPRKVFKSIPFEADGKSIKEEFDKNKKKFWLDYNDEGFVECPICGAATNCEDNIDELKFCFSCGTRLFNKGGEKNDGLHDIN